MTQPTLNLSQISDDPWYTGLLTKLNILQPVLIIVPHTIYDARPETVEAKMLQFVRLQFPAFNILKIPRRHFNNADGKELLTKHCSENYDSLRRSIEQKYYALSAVSGLLKYLEHVFAIHFIERSLKLVFTSKFAHMLIGKKCGFQTTSSQSLSRSCFLFYLCKLADVDSTHRLELLSPMTFRTSTKNHVSLFALLNNCITSIGKRTLRARILQPMCDTAEIHRIHECVQELINTDTQLVHTLHTLLHDFNSVDRLSKLTMVVPQDSNIRTAEILINRTVQLKRCLHMVVPLQTALVHFDSKVLREIYESLNDVRYRTILDHVERVVKKDIGNYGGGARSLLLQRIHCVKDGVSELLDFARGIYKELIAKVKGWTWRLRDAIRLDLTAFIVVVDCRIDGQFVIETRLCIENGAQHLPRILYASDTASRPANHRVSR